MSSFDFSGWFFKDVFYIRNKLRIIVFGKFYSLICSIKGMYIGKNVILNGRPIIRRFPGSIIKVGNNCEFNSAKDSVLIRLSRPCSFITLRNDAEIIIGNETGISGALLVAALSIKIGNNVLIGANSTIIDNDFHNSDSRKRRLNENPSRAVVIEDNVFIGFNCLILKGVTIGENSVIGANSVVISSIPKNSIAIGNPCKVVITKRWE